MFFLTNKDVLLDEKEVFVTKTLFETLRSDLQIGENLAARLHAIDTHDFSGVMRKVREEMAKRGIQVTNDWLEAGVLALKQYYAIAVLDGVNRHAVSNRVDDFWHAHILHTRQYIDFCNEVADRYLQHDPLDHAVAEDVGYVGRLYNFTVKQYDKCFTYVDEEFFPRHLESAMLVCLHGGEDSATAYALFGASPEARPDGTSFVQQ